jgi:putative endonuclease
MQYFVYILYAPIFDKFYIGQTQDIETRLISHNETAEFSYTSKYRPWQLVYCMPVQSRSLAMQLEKCIKSQKSKEFIKKLLEERSKSLLSVEFKLD